MTESPQVNDGVRLGLGESPVWDAQSDRLMLVDVAGADLCRLNLSTGRLERRRIGGRLSAVVPRTGGGWLLVAGRRLIALADWTAPQVTLRKLPGELDLNDAACDAAGRLYVGSVDRRHRRHGVLYRVDPDLAVDIVATGVGASNGLAADPDGHTVWHADTFAGTVRGHPGGTVRCRPEQPDGLAVDVDGRLWVACWDGWRIERYTPDGELDRRVDLPAARVTNCAFVPGGLVVTTASGPGSAAGSVLLVADVGAGAPVHPFGG